MMAALFRRLLPTPQRSAAAGSAFLVVAAVLLARHAAAIRTVREVGLPVYVAVPALERRLEVLREQAEVSELQRSLAEGSGEELVKAFVIPEEPGIDRLLGFVELVQNYLEGEKMLRAPSAVRVEDAPTTGDLRPQRIAFEADMTEEGMHMLLRAVDLSGFVAVADALTDEEVRRLLRVTEEENPASIAGIEHFLSTPLLRYGLEPKPFEEQVRRSFVSASFEQSFDDLLRHSALADARAFLASTLGQAIARERFWPMRFLTLEELSIEPRDGKWMRVGVIIRAYARTVAG